jgi:hypothetical protein
MPNSANGAIDMETIAVSKDGHRIGERHHNAVLTDAQVAELRALYQSGIGSCRLAQRFGEIHRIPNSNRKAPQGAPSPRHKGDQRR